ncbi:fumarate reductase [Arsukibacterium ikkense]|uniref:Fumarate reductase n=1 Tax=Arsukibacterium ikkense TaxID=336831 RepID=A0A0M2V1F7_9GAMM|nr:fumarate reductase [Arsukibacterium ikkense]KKO44476.1 fumarate reductase [Arsukibacterium ikkense]
MSDKPVSNKTAPGPYQPVMHRYWWLQHRYFRLYMLREATVLPLLFFIGCLLYGLYCLGQSEAQWQGWLAFMAQPWVVLLNLLAFIASLFHAKTFFELFPRVMPLAPAGFMIAGQWLATLLVAAGLIVILGGWI